MPQRNEPSRQEPARVSGSCWELLLMTRYIQYHTNDFDPSKGPTHEKTKIFGQMLLENCKFDQNLKCCRPLVGETMLLSNPRRQGRTRSLLITPLPSLSRSWDLLWPCPPHLYSLFLLILPQPTFLTLPLSRWKLRRCSSSSLSLIDSGSPPFRAERGGERAMGKASEQGDVQLEELERG